MTEAQAYVSGQCFRRFAALGDSFSAGAEGDTAVPWPEHVARLLASDTELAYRNFAIAGAISTDVAIWQLQRAVEFRPDLISVICGANDVLFSGPPDTEVFTAVFDGIIDSLRRRLPRTTIVTATYPRIGSLLSVRERTSTQIESGMDAINMAIREIAARRNLICIEWAGQPAINDRQGGGNDQFHPSAEGHRRAAVAFVEGLTAALGPCVSGKDAV